MIVGKQFINQIRLCLDDSLWAIQFKFSCKIPYFYFLLPEKITKLLRLTANSTSHQNLKIQKLLNCEIKFPRQSLIDKFNNFCKPIFELQKSNEQIIKRLLRMQK